ncbi:MAG: hypothetical protein DRO00_00360 [Thermoproteota archaeon]|nr:MAG: hypothetical protein DRO00_00360 [Candidatus Korarchaeota archaeon]
MTPKETIFWLVAQVLPYVTLSFFVGGIILKVKRWVRAGNWIRTSSSPFKWFPYFVKKTISDLLLFSKIYKQRKAFWFQSLGFHAAIFMILFGHLRGFGVWSKESLERISINITSFLVETFPLYIGIASTILLAGLMVYRVINKTLRLHSEPEDYIATALVLLTVASGTAMRLLPPDSLKSMTIRFLPGIILRIEKTPNIPSFLIHIMAAQLLLMYLPFSKLIHIISAIPNVASCSIEEMAEEFIPNLIEYAEKAETKEKISERGIDFSTLPGKFILSLETCVTCSNCTSNCPTYSLSGEKAHIPGTRLRGIYRAYNQTSSIFRIFSPIIERQSLEKMIWECALCGYCSKNCPLAIKTDSIYLMLRMLMAKAAWMPESLVEFSRTIRNVHNPLGRDNKERLWWVRFRLSRNKKAIDKLGPEAAPMYFEVTVDDILKGKAETVYFIGCNASFFRALSGVPDAMVHILKAVGEDFTILGEEEWCCGYPLLLAGDILGLKEMAIHNIEAIRAKGAKKVVFTCAGCYRVFKHFYTKLLGIKLGFEVIHSTELLYSLCSQRRLNLVAPRIRATYHDPCDIGRHDGIYLEPRIVLKLVGSDLVEMEKIEEDSFCCGGGGLLKLSNSDLSGKVSIERAKQAAETGAEFIITACPFCELSLREGAQSLKGNKLKVLDITEVVAIQTGLLPLY